MGDLDSIKGLIRTNRVTKMLLSLISLFSSFLSLSHPSSHPPPHPHPSLTLSLSLPFLPLSLDWAHLELV